MNNMTRGRQTGVLQIITHSLTVSRIDGTFLSWSFDLRKTLLSSYPLPEGLEPIPAEVLLPPKYELEILDDAQLRKSIHLTSYGISSSTRNEGLDISFSSATLKETIPPALEQSGREKGTKRTAPKL